VSETTSSEKEKQMQVKSVNQNEVNQDRAPCAQGAQVVLAIAEDYEDIGVEQNDAQTILGSSEKQVDDVAVVSSVDPDSADVDSGEVESDVNSVSDSGDQGVGATSGEVATFLATDPAKGGKAGEGGAGEISADAGGNLTVFAPEPPECGKGGEGGGDPKPVTATPVVDDSTVFAVGPAEAGKGGKGGEGGVWGNLQVSNSAFVQALSVGLPQGAVLAVCSKPGDPQQGGWFAQRADDVDSQCWSGRNNYVNTAAFFPEADGSVRARQSNFAALVAIVLDDVGTKVPPERLAGIEASWEIETSPGNFQVGFILSRPITDVQKATKYQAAYVAAGLCDSGATGATRWVRIPKAINGKPKHRNRSGQTWACKLRVWNPDKRFTPEELLAAFGLTLANEPARNSHDVVAVGQSPMAKKVDWSDNEVYTPKAAENPVITALKAQGLYKRQTSEGKHDVTCPWVGEHTDALDTGAAYFEPSKQFPTGGFRCQHSHGDKHHIGDLLEFLEVDSSEARHKARIRLIPGEINVVVDAAELVLVERGNYYQAGGLIVTIKVDPKTGDPSILPVSEQALTQELAACADWEKFDGRCKAWVRTDPPPRYVSMLYKAQQYKHLPVLLGVTRQPYFREEDGQIVTVPGYDAGSQRFGVFDESQYVLPEPTREEAQAALTKLRALLCEFHFAQPHDEAASVSGMFTAVLRPSIELAPAIHAKAHSIGSGKTLLCEVIGAMAGPGGNRKLSYPKTSEEASKVILSALLEGPAVVEFDDMDTDWLPHGVINRMLTSTHMTERILGSSKVATVSTRTLFLGSGNNVGPIRDLVRRVITITLDPQCATPATLQYQGDPLATVRKNRAELVCAVLTIVRAWRLAGSPKSNVPNIASYGGAWSDYCRHPLIWLGLPDPATALFEQLKNDPDREALGKLLREWYRRFGSAPTTVRKVVAKAHELAEDHSYGGSGSTGDHDLMDAICEFPVSERGVINSSKFGWLLKRNAMRIVDGLRFEEAQADGRKAWRVVDTATPPSPPLPACDPSDAKTVTPASAEVGEFDPIDLF
jgi:hypothetical protein